MNEEQVIERIVSALHKVPERKLRLIELANRVKIINGQLDYAELLNLAPEINLATKEAEVYGSNTIRMVDALVRVRAKGEK
jgi:hypothetical protein